MRSVTTILIGISITYIANEIRSILENLIAIGVHPPAFLAKGLDVASKMINDKTEE